MKTHLIEVAEHFRRVFAVDGKNAQVCVDRMEELCNNDIVDVTKLTTPPDGKQGTDFTRSVRQLYMVVEENNDWYANLMTRIPADVSDEEIRVLCHGEPAVNYSRLLSEDDVRKVRALTDEFYDGVTKYQEDLQDSGDFCGPFEQILKFIDQAVETKATIARSVDELLRSNDHNLDGSDHYAEGYHDALLDILKILGVETERQHFD